MGTLLLQKFDNITKHG